MKNSILTALAIGAVACLLPACTTVETPAPTTTTSTTTESHSIRTPVGAATTATTVRSY